MSVLSRALKGAALSGLVATGAMAEGVAANDVSLNRAEWTALEVVKNFNVCVDRAESATSVLPSAQAITDAWVDRRDAKEEYYETVIVPYEAALTEYRDQNGYTDKAAALRYKLIELYSPALEQNKSTPENNPLMAVYGFINDQYDALQDKSKAEFDAITTLEIPEKEDFVAQLGDAYPTLIEGCTQEMADNVAGWMQTNYPNWGRSDGSRTSFAFSQSNFRVQNSALREKLGPETYLELTQAPKPMAP